MLADKFAGVLRNFVLFSALISMLTSVQPLHAKDEHPKTITVYLDINFASKKKRGAKKITESHIKYEKLGYRFVDLELYVENGDLRGFFITYTHN